MASKENTKTADVLKIPSGYIKPNLCQIESDGNNRIALSIYKETHAFALGILEYDMDNKVCNMGSIWEIADKNNLHSMLVEKVEDDCWHLTGKNGVILEIRRVPGVHITFSILDPTKVSPSSLCFMQSTTQGLSPAFSAACNTLTYVLHHDSDNNVNYYPYIEKLYEVIPRN